MGGDKERATATYDKAIGLVLNNLKVNPRNAGARGDLALYYAKKGDQARARRMMADARGVEPNNVDLMYAEAIIANLGGRTAEALAALGAALKAGYPLSSAQNDPDLRSLSSDPGFKALVEQYALEKNPNAGSSTARGGGRRAPRRLGQAVRASPVPEQ